jgi:hypothetical protein
MLVLSELPNFRIRGDHEKFSNHFKLQLDYINKTKGFEVVNVEDIIAYRYQGNLYGLFKELNIPAFMYEYTAYINGYLDPVDYDGTQTMFKIIDQNDYEHLQAIFSTL